MSFVYGPYTAGSPAGASLTDAEWGEMAKAFLGTGVIRGALIAGSAGNDFAVSAPGTGMTVNVGTGQAMVYGHWCQNDASSAQTITTADPTNPRIDRVVLKHDVTAKTVSIVVKAGTPGASPVAPGLTQTPSIWELTLCQVRVNAGVTSVTSANVTDERTYATPTNAVNKTGDTMTGTLGVTQTLGGSNKVFADFTATDGKRYQIFISTTGNFGIFNVTDNVVVLSLGPAGGTIFAGGNTVWTAANDGSGSGLDADSVDGQHAAAFLGATAQAADSAKLGGVAAAAYALLAGATFTGTVNVSSGSLQQGGKNAVLATVGLTGKFSAQTTAPTSPADGDLWLDTSTVLA